MERQRGGGGTYFRDPWERIMWSCVEATSRGEDWVDEGHQASLPLEKRLRQSQKPWPS